MTGQRVGIEGLNAFCGVARIPVRTLFTERGLDPNRYDNLMMEQRSVQMPWEDPVTNAVNAARPLLDALDRDDHNGSSERNDHSDHGEHSDHSEHSEHSGRSGRERIELLITSTESGVDYSKSVASYVHDHLGLSRRCRVMEVKQACYGATGALQLASGYLSASADPLARALVIATDVNPMDAHARYAEPATGHGAVALLLGTGPGILALDPGGYGLHSFEAMDTARPRPDLDLYHADLSLLTYLECLSASYADYRRRVPAASWPDSFDYLVMHTPFAGMVKAAHRRLARELAPGPPGAVEEDFARRVAPSLAYARTVGNLCSGSVYLALASLLDHAPGDATAHARVGLYSYGSGCASEFFSGVLAEGAAGRVGAMGIAGRLRGRRELTFKEYERLLPAARACLVPRPEHTVDLSECDDTLRPLRAHGPLLVLTGIENYHRKYTWR